MTARFTSRVMSPRKGMSHRKGARQGRRNCVSLSDGSMINKPQRNFTRLEGQTQRLLRDLEGWTPEALRFRPGPNAWSAMDVLDHVRLSERGALASMRANLHADHRISFNDRFRNAIVLGVMLLPTRVKVPASARSISPSRAQLTVSAIQMEWEADRKQLSAFLEPLTAAEEELAAFRHPVGGWTTVNGALLFLRSHLHHHSYQFARLRKEWNRTANNTAPDS